MHIEIGPGPQRIQIQTQSGCNGRCVFCPNGDILKAGLKQGRMELGLFRKIIDDLAETPPHRISPYLMNEPLLDLRLPEFVAYVSERIPQATTLVTSNGTNLTEEMGDALIGAGLKRLKVSLQSLDSPVNKQLMGEWCDSDRIVRNVLAFKKQITARKSKLDLRISMIVTKLNHTEIEKARRFWRKHGIRLVTSALENRGGNVALQAAELNPHTMACYNTDCVRPSREMCILWNGDAVLCCVDWWRTVVLGNAGEQRVQDIWLGARLDGIRQALRENNKTAMPTICARCEQSAQPDYHRKGLKGFIKRHFGGRTPHERHTTP